MTKEQIVKLAVENNLVAEVYDILHYIVIARIGALQNKSDKLNSELRLIKKFADANKLDVIKDILTEGEEQTEKKNCQTCKRYKPDNPYCECCFDFDKYERKETNE